MEEPSSTSNPCLKYSTTVLAPAERWRSESEQQNYSTKLINTLSHLRRPDSADAAARAVRDTANRVLVNSAKGRTRWSRAMLTRRIRRKHKSAARLGSDFRNPAVRTNRARLRRKVRVLSRLVPGCRKASLPSLIEETTDYIAALEMQVKTMALLNRLLNGGVFG